MWNLSREFLAPNYIEVTCVPSCPLQCNRTQYTTMISSSALNGAWYVETIRSNLNLAADFVGTPLNADTARESVARVNVYYPTLSYTLSLEAPYMDAVALLGSIGGTLGLFMGISVLSVSEIVEVLMEIYFISTNTNISINK